MSEALLIAVLLSLPAIGLATVRVPKVGVVDDRLLPRNDWVASWRNDWAAATVVSHLRNRGVQAEIIGAQVLRAPAMLKTFDAVLIPTDHGYPDIGARVGPIARAIREYVRAGGVYIMPMGASHSRWRDVDSGTISEDMGANVDFLGLHWRVTGNHQGPAAPMHLTEAGRQAGLDAAGLPTGVAPYTRSFTEAGVAYVEDDAHHPCLSATAVGEGVVIHYAGGLPFDASVRDWLLDSYATLLKTGIDREAVTKATWASIAASRVYTMVPVARRSTALEMDLDGTWELAEANRPSVDLDDLTGLSWTPVRMPNSVQNALFEAGKIANPWVADNSKDLQWISQRDWCLRKRFRVPPAWKGRHVRLRFDGLDYIGTVWLDGKPLGTHEGMLGGPTFDVDLDPATEHELLVRIQAGSGTCSTVIKPDLLCGLSMWGNKYWSLGLWAPVRLVATGPAYLEAPYVRTDSIEAGVARLWAQATVFNAGEDFDGTVRARIVDAKGEVVWRADTKQAVPAGGSFWERPIEIRNAQLWWPNGMGEHPLYTLELSILRNGSRYDVIRTRFGIRTLEIRRNPSFPASPRRVSGSTTAPDESGAAAWDWEGADEAYRWLFVVNGRPFFATGASWLTSDDLLTLNEDREAWMIDAARAAGIRLFRLNGGTSIFETDRFYDLCDRSGILVWQEFPLNWADHSLAPLGAWRDQITQSVLRIRSHPSLALYVAGNEYNPVAPGLAAVLGIAREIVDGMDGRPFRMSSPGAERFANPGGGTYHAYIIPQVWAGDPNWYFHYWGKGANFISEWSLYAYANYSCLERMLPRAELGPEPVGMSFDEFLRRKPMLNVTRFAEPHFARFIFQMASWYGDLSKAGLAEFTEFSQTAHAATYGYLYENWRTEFPYKGGHTVWTWNVPEPVSSWSVMDWFGKPEIAYYAIKRACEPVHVCARTTWNSWGPGETFHATVQALADAPGRLDGLTMSATMLDPTMRKVASKHWTVSLPGGQLPGPAKVIRWKIPADLADGYIFLVVSLADSSGKRLSRQVYWMRVLGSLADPEARKARDSRPVEDALCDKGPWLSSQLERVPTTLSARIVEASVDGKDARVTVTVRNTGRKPAFSVRLQALPDAYTDIWDDACFWLEPGETRTITGRIRLDMRGMDPVTKPRIARLKDLAIECRAWNAPAVRLPVSGGN